MGGHERRARAAARKPAPLGPDIDIGAYVATEGPQGGGAELTDADRQALAELGFDSSGQVGSGSFLHVDRGTCLVRSRDPDVEVLDIRQALDRHGGLLDYWWQAVPVDADKYTAHADLAPSGGYFIRVRRGAHVELPVQTCLILARDNLDQTVHNVVVVEGGASLRLFTGCAASPGVHRGLHIGVSEFYVKPGARLTFTMVHNWSEEVAVRPRSGIVVEEGGAFVSKYIALRPVRTVQTFPTVRLASGASAKLTSVLYAHPGSEMDVGGRVELEGEDASAQVISRAVTAGGSVVARGHLAGKVRGVRAHLECNALILDERGRVAAIPELEASHPDVTMTHEAAVGKIAPEEIQYLQARGLTEDEATSLLVRGFLEVEMEDVGDELRAEIDRLFTGMRGM